MNRAEMNDIESAFLEAVERAKDNQISSYPETVSPSNVSGSTGLIIQKYTEGPYSYCIMKINQDGSQGGLICLTKQGVKELISALIAAM